MDKGLVNAEARIRFRPDTTDNPIASTQDIDSYADWIVDELTSIAELAAPKRFPSRPRRQPWWNDQVQAAVRAARKTHRQRRSRRTEEHWKFAQEAEDEQIRVIKDERRSSLRSGLPPESRQIPPLLRLVGNDMVPSNTHEEKAVAFAERFFPHSTARTSDIPTDIAHRLDTAPFPSEDHLTQEEIKVIIKRLSSSGCGSGPSSIFTAPGR
ncbi:hypothetical protein E4U26_008107 [Claviceps purpurea]|nr:hypothetical protein E4U26_008107 [Claviceps purpurea]